ncbi:MAG: carboxymuconolactone decarboxylase family protein [Phycisphaerae bacterium]|nr:carboxymuconolactone decarboxylase family protein [Saprospiraceae bacterium]
MPHITLPEQSLGIRSLAEYRPDTGQHLYELAQTLLRGESSLSEAERELIAAFVSYRNQCTFCFSSHAAASRYLFQDDAQVVDFVLNDYENAPISAKLKLLLSIAACVQTDARTVSDALVAEARSNGAVDRDIHDTVLIAATFCLFNRYVDGLATITPPAEDAETWAAMGERLGKNGYVAPKTNLNL